MLAGTFPVIQLLGSLEVAALLSGHPLASQMFPVIQLLGSLEEGNHRRFVHSNVQFPVIQLLGSLEANHPCSRQMVSPGVSSNSASRKLGRRDHCYGWESNCHGFQ